MHQLGSEATGFIFSGLVAGRLYRAEVLSQSGGLSNRASTLGRTGKMQLLLELRSPQYPLIFSQQFQWFSKRHFSSFISAARSRNIK